MATREIGRDEWVPFFDKWSKQHEDWLVTVEVSGNGANRRVEARDVPLEAIAASLKKGDDDTISIIMATRKDEVETHSISGAKHVRVLQTDNGQDQGLEIDGRDGTTYVRLRSPVPPETVDGVI